MLPGKKYTPEDILLILRRRYWLVLVPLAVVGAAAVLWARTMPDWYRAETLIMVVPQRVSENYVRATVSSRIEDRLNSISQQILSRTRLERVIQDFDLYKEERRVGIMEDVVERMRKDIGVQVVKGDAFRVSYVGRDPRTVTKVTERLASLFIEENLKEREQQADNTNQFLEVQLEDARRRLIEQEQKVEAYRRLHSGQLPTQLDSNLQAIQNTQMQIQAVVESINSDRNRRLLLERQISDLASVGADASGASTQVAPDGTPVGGGNTAGQRLETARLQLNQLQVRLKPEHPDIGLMKRRIRELEREAETEALASPLTPAPSASDKRLANLRAELSQLDEQIAKKAEEESRLRSVSAAYQARVDAVPSRETEMVELTRDYTGLQAVYASLLQKKEDSKLAANLERRQIGETFKLLDPARLPERPFKPNRQLFHLMGIAIGFGLGLVIVGLLEYRDRSFRSDQDLARVLALPVLAVVPVMQSDSERRRTFRQRVAANVALGSTVATGLGIVIYAFLR